MSGPPDTRHSLIARLPAAVVDGVAVAGADEAAWHEFVEAYEPFLYAFGRRHGMQDSDASELVQLVLVSVAGSVQRWQPAETNGARPPFRSWLRTIARNHLINHLKSKPRHSSVGGTTNLQAIGAAPAEAKSSDEGLDIEFRRAVFRHSAAKVRDAVQPDTWQAFWLTALEGKSCQEVANDLGMGLGSVYAARSRVTARLREEVQMFDDLSCGDSDQAGNGGVE